MAKIISAERIANLRRLLVEFGRREMGCQDVVQHLGCSVADARYYLRRVFEDGVVVRCADMPAASLDSRGYRLAQDRRALYRLDAELYQYQLRHDAAAGNRPPARPLAGSEWLDKAIAAPGPGNARRDPLVAALFGAGRMGSPAA